MIPISRLLSGWVVATAVASSLPTYAAAATETGEVAAAVSDWVETFFAEEMAKQGVPGAAFALVKDGEIVLLRGYGFSDLEMQTEVDPRRTVFRVGSLSKTLTALTALELVASGDLDLHADIDGPIGGVTVPATFEQPVTLHHLLTHSAGFGERLFGQHVRSPDELLTLSEYLERRLPPRQRPPGVVIGYNDHHTTLVGLLVEVATEEGFARAARRRILEPLGLESSTFLQVDLPRDIEPRLAKAYRRLGERTLPLARDYVHTVPAAGLFTTAEDMGRLLVALLDGGRLDGQQALSEATVAAALATQFRHGEGMRGRGYGLAEGRDRGRRTLYKDGQCSGFTARLFLVPEEHIGWFSVVNLSIFGRAGSFLGVSRLHRRLSSGLMEQLFAAEVEDAGSPPAADQSPPPVAMAGAAGRVRRYLGTYRDTMDPRFGWEGNLLANEVRVTAGDDGTLQALGGAWVETEPGTFEYTDGGPVYLRFKSDADGSPRWLTYHAGAWERLAWYQTARFRLLAALVLLPFMMTPGIALLLARRRRRPVPAGAPWLAASAACLVLFPLALLATMVFTDIQALYSGLTAPLRAVFVVPWIALALAAAGIAQWLRGRNQEGARSSGYWTLVAGACGLALVLLRLGHLLDWPP